MYGQAGPSRSDVSERHTSRGSRVDLSEGGRGFFQSLFDFSFSYFVTPKLVRLAYVFAVLGFGLLAAGGLIMGLARGGGTALAAVVFIPLVFLAWTAFVRIVLEIFIVVFRIAEPVRDAASSLDELRRLTLQDASRVTQVPDPETDAVSSSAGQAGAGSATDTGDGGGDNPPPDSGSALAGAEELHMGRRFCVKCGEENKPEFKFCFSCGTDLA